MGNIVEALRQELEALAAARVRAEVAAQVVREAKAVWEQQNAAALTEMEAAKAAATQLEGTVRTLAVMAGELTGEKRPAPGVELRVTTTVTITDQDAALAWARASRIGYVPETIDGKAIEQAATKAKLALPFLRTDTTFKAVVATDLVGAFLKAAASAPSVEVA